MRHEALQSLRRRLDVRGHVRHRTPSPLPQRPSDLPWERGQLARFNSPVGLRPTCGRDARAPRNRSARCLSRERGHLARFNSPVGLRPTAGGTPALPGTPPLGAFPRSAGILPASTHRWACGPLAGGSPALPGTTPLGCLSRERGRLARLNTLVGLRSTCGRVARAPRETPAQGAFPGPRASCPLQLTGGPSAHLRARRPRSQGHPLRTAPFPGPRAACPLQHTGGPSAHLRAGRPRSQEPLRSAPSWERGHLARFNSPVGLRPTAGGTPALPGRRLRRVGATGTTSAPVSIIPGAR